MAALALAHMAVAVTRSRSINRGTAGRRGLRHRRRHARLRLPPPATLALVALALELRHARVVQRVVAELEYRGRTDALTGLGNRWAFDDDLAGRLRSTSISRMRRRWDPEPATLLLADIDHFKRYNDRYGHPTGDEALVRVAGAMREACRVGDGIYRLGGEEFAILLTADHHEALLIADRIRRTVASAMGGALTVSLGVATADADGEQALVARADRALYEAKSRGRNRVSTRMRNATVRGSAVGQPPSHHG